jgi:hypothetical protein
LTSLCGPNHNNDQPSTLRDVEELGLQKRETKFPDNKVGEDTQTANNQISHRDKHNAAPDERVCQCFLNLMHLILLIPDAGFVVTDALDEETLLILRVAFGCHRAVGKEVTNDE